MTLYIVVITVVFSLIAFNNSNFFYKAQFSPYLINQNKEWFRFFSHGLIHADWIHLFFNMYVLYSFGSATEFFYDEYFGSKGSLFFILLYIGALFTSSIPAYEKHKHNSWYKAVGASGAVSAVVFATILFSPLAPIGILFIPFGIPAFIFGFLYLGYSFYMAKKDADFIAHDAHFFGALFGIMFTILLDRQIGANFINIVLNYVSG